MTIHYLVLAGGGPNGFVTYGSLLQTALTNMWNIKDIKMLLWRVYRNDCFAWLSVGMGQ